MYRLTATNGRRTVIETYFTAFAAEIARKVYESRKYVVTVEEQ